MNNPNEKVASALIAHLNNDCFVITSFNFVLSHWYGIPPHFVAIRNAYTMSWKPSELIMMKT